GDHDVIDIGAPRGIGHVDSITLVELLLRGLRFLRHGAVLVRRNRLDRAAVVAGDVVFDFARIDRLVDLRLVTAAECRYVIKPVINILSYQVMQAVQIGITGTLFIDQVAGVGAQQYREYGKRQVILRYRRFDCAGHADYRLPDMAFDAKEI